MLFVTYASMDIVEPNFLTIRWMQQLDYICDWSAQYVPEKN